ncbi:hypothetical protein LK994_13455 [Ferruginibacter lapsinanis]|uniref:nuclear transport factor 2 family protein n=1 Tax=Ferruginibacter lapsinanis TaxID=563172 RepID=UPI001E2F4182|nr:hypothetical protein [Ferruginibacter lapsinanis]UEG49643.1 hypothetical protein LK994_13455 [Ferruginibacter lapsinanis]
MKKLHVCLIALLSMIACNQKPSMENADKKDSDAKAKYEKNLATVKASVVAFENKQADAFAATLADSAVWVPAVYGTVPGKKADYCNDSKWYWDNFDSIQLINAAYLPGLDSLTHEFDGSVRYYGTWISKHKSGVKTSLNYYATFDFNKDNKIVYAAEFYDAGGLMNAIKAK